MKTPEELKVLHDQRQIGLAKNQICIREGIVLKVAEESRYGFEFFTFRSPEMAIGEMDSFILYARGKKCLIDAGALHGIYSLVFAKINKTGLVVAFEPEPTAYKILGANIFLNRLNIVNYNRALSNKIGVIKMKKEWEHFVASDDGDNESECIDGDQVVNRLNVKPDMLKIDVESAELNVLKGLSKTISDNHPTIFLELHNERIINKGGSVKDVTDLLINWGYIAIDTRTNDRISFNDILKVTTGELRLILI